MIADLKPYPEHKDSGLSWLGKVPGHWKVMRSKSIFQRVDQRSTSGKEELLTVSSARGIVPRNTATVTMFKAESYKGYKLCWPGDLVINSLWAWANGLGVSRYHGIISSAYGVYRIRPHASMDPSFIHELVRSSPFNWELHIRSKGIWISRLQLTDESFFDAPIPIPPPAEQSAIVRFLNWANDRLDRAVRAKRKTISLLNEQKQAIIHRAVTRGLDPNVKLKDSGIPWLGKIPEHWEVKRAKYVFKSIDVRSKKGVEELLTVSSSDGIVPRSTKTVLMFKAASYTGHKLCWPGDLVINSLWAWAKGLGVSSHYGIVSTAYGVYRPRTSYSGHALYWHELLRSPAYDWEFQTRSKGIWKSRLQLTDDSFFAMLIVVPPEEASTKIVHHIRESTGGINAAITRLEREIELLREYRTRLTADIVTGKLDVREAAETLPDTPVEPADPVPSFADTELDETLDPEEAPDVAD